MNDSLAKYKQVLRILFREPFTCNIHITLVLFCYALSEFAMYISIEPTPQPLSLLLGALFAFVLTGICLILPPMTGRIFFAISSFGITVWAMAQIVYYDMFQRLMWIHDVGFTSEGVIFIDDVLNFYAPLLWWILVGIWIFSYLMVLLHWPIKRTSAQYKRKLCIGLFSALITLGIVENSALINKSDAMLGTMPVYYHNGYYHLLKEDIAANFITPHLPNYEDKQQEYHQQITQYFAQRTAHEVNAMTGILEGKNVIIVLMESLDDWMITPEHMPMMSEIMEQSIVFTDFYTPFYGITRSINTEVCLNTGVYFPTNGNYFYDYLSNSFAHSLPNTLRSYGYTSQVFHHNDPDYYHRTELIPTLGYDKYQSYMADSRQEQVLNDCYPFDSQAMRQQFFREGRTFNMLITQAAHMPYRYEDAMSIYALERHPEYYGAFGSEEEDCIRVKARLVDDTFARLFAELEQEGQLDNTVILALSDHFPYGYTDTEQLLAFAGGDDLMFLDNTPCFIWSTDLTPMTVTKTLNTADLLPTLLNLLGITPDYLYPGRDAFDPDYEGYAFFSNGSCVREGVMCKKNITANQPELEVIHNKYGKAVSAEWLSETMKASQEFIEMNNLILMSDYYRQN